MTPRIAIVAAMLAVRLVAQASDVDRARLDLTEMRRLPVLSGTRFQALESYAREVVLTVTGEVEPKRAPDGTAIKRGSSADRKRGDPVLTYLEWWLVPEEARKVPWVFIDRPGTRKLLGYPTDQKEYTHASYDELTANRGFLDLIDSLKKRPRASFSLDEAEVIHVYERLVVFAREAGLLPEQESLPEEIRGGPNIVPPKGAMVRGVKYEWKPLGVLAAPGKDFDYDRTQVEALRGAYTKLRESFRSADAAAFPANSVALRTAIQGLRSPHNPDLAVMDREVRYHLWHFFDRAAWLYLATFILAIFAAIWKNKIFYVAAALPGLAGLCLNVYGLAERTALSERALIGNLYETLLYLGAVAFTLSLACEGFFRSRWFLITGSLLAMAFLRIAQDQALLMNPAISTLQPVLDNNFWIHIHVPVIVASYAPLTLAALMGNLYLLLAIFRPSSSPALQEVGRIQYWAMIPGVILLFAGLILGGIWADQSWGRFWGWDPKETWGFITWLVFVLLIHGRWSGWLRDYGTAVGAIIGGSALIMTYWGVNFMLPGLHSYASANDGSAGLRWFERIPVWIYSYVGFEVALITLAAFSRRHAGGDVTVALRSDP